MVPGMEASAMSGEPEGPRQGAGVGGRLLLALLAVAAVDAATMLLAVVEGPYPGVVPRGTPTAYKNLYIHVPVSIATYFAFTVALVSAVLFLSRGGQTYDRTAHSAIVVGVVLGAASLGTGIIWANESWGAPWNWDPRQTGVLLMWVAYLVYLAIRASVKDPDLAPRISMVYAVAAYATVPLGFLLPYVMPSLHPVARETAEFVGRAGLAALLLPARTLLACAFAALLIMVYRRVVAGLAVDVKAVYAALFVLASGFALLAAYHDSFIGPPELRRAEPGKPVEFRGMVVGGEYDGNTLILAVSSGGRLVTVRYAGEPPVRPVVVELNGARVLTLEKHQVIVSGRVIDEGLVEASELRVILYWGVPANAVIYAASFAAPVCAAVVRSQRRKVTAESYRASRYG